MIIGRSAQLLVYVFVDTGSVDDGGLLSGIIKKIYYITGFTLVDSHNANRHDWAGALI